MPKIASVASRLRDLAEIGVKHKSAKAALGDFSQLLRKLVHNVQVDALTILRNLIRVFLMILYFTLIRL